MSFLAGLLQLMSHPPLLGNGQDVVDQPVHNQAAGECQEEEGEDNWQDHHDLLLLGVNTLGSHLLLDEHGEAHDDGSNVQGVSGREVAQPGNVREWQGINETGVAHFNGCQQGLVEAEEDRHLDKNRNATAGRIDVVGLVESHDFLVHGFLVVFVLFLDLLHHGSKLLHLFHGRIALCSKRPENNLDNNGQQDDGNAPVADIGIEEVKNPQKALGDAAEHAKID